MKIEIDYIGYHTKTDPTDLNVPIEQLDRDLIKESLLSHKDIIKCSVDDLGPFLWIEIQTIPEFNQEHLSALIKEIFKDNLIVK